MSFQPDVPHFDKVLKKQPDNNEALSGSGIALTAMENRGAAQKMFERVLQLESQKSKASLNLGEFLYDEGKIDQALKSFDQALVLDPDYSVAKWRKSFALLAKGDYKEG